jgi:multimeric flavodoxin WrbA
LKIIVINGSPKGEGSNSLKLTKAFLAGLEEPDARFYHLANREVRPCKGCYACWKATPGVCVMQDGAKDVIEALREAELVIWSFPLYYFSVPGLLKNLIDRQLPNVLPFMAERPDALGSGSHPMRYDVSGQRHVVISTCGFYSSEGNYDSVCGLFDHMCGQENYTGIFCGQGELFSRTELRQRTDEYLTLVETAGVEYKRAGAISEGTQDLLRQLLYAKEIFEELADASWSVARDGQTAVDDSLVFIRLMAALYNKDSYNGKRRILEFYFTDMQKTYQILLTGAGHEVMTENFAAYTTRIETPFSVWRDIATGKISGPEALSQHLYRVLGDFDIMLRWNEFFSGGVSGAANAANAGNAANTAAIQKKTNMTVMLLPWIFAWVVLAINPQWGGASAILLCAALPLLWLRYRPVAFEYISVSAVSGIALFTLLGANMRLTVPLSYALFGSMWFATGFMKIPLTAYYTQSAYGGGQALSNPLFIRTNRILTFAWGALYLITPIWTWALLGTGVSYLTGAFNSVLPALMGLFTRWFQRWYPAQFAQR